MMKQKFVFSAILLLAILLLFYSWDNKQTKKDPALECAKKTIIDSSNFDFYDFNQHLFR